MRHFLSPSLLLVARPLVLLVGHFLHPVDNLAVQLFLDGDMGHGRARRRPMPMLLARRAPYDVARSDHADRPAPALDQPAARRDDQGLTQRMRVPIAPGRTARTSRRRRSRVPAPAP